MPRPDFLIIGAQKAGTSWLAHNLGQHPGVYLPPDELHFFDKSARFARGRSWYEAQFAPPPGVLRVGEKTPDYLWSEEGGAEDHTPGIAERIHGAYPDLRLICVLRDPVTRAVSAARHLRLNRPGAPVDVAGCPAGRRRDAHGRRARCPRPGILCPFLATLSWPVRRRADMRPVLRGRPARRPSGYAAGVCHFLGVETAFDFPDRGRRINDLGFSRLGLALSHALPWLGRPIRALDRRWATPYRPEASGRTLAALARLYAPANAELFALLGRSASNWRMA